MKRKAHTVVKHRFVRTGPGRPARVKVRYALRYMERRVLGADEQAEDRSLFDRDVDGVQRTDAAARLAAWSTKRVAYHRFILSPGPGSEAMTRDDTVLWTRRVLADLDVRVGRQVVWVAAMHRHTSHLHIHVVVGASTERDGGKRVELRFTPADYAALRESGDRWSAQASADRALLREIECYLAYAVGATITGVARRIGSSQERVEDDEEADRRRHHDDRPR